MTDAAAGFIAIFFVGLALNLTPCVYPMLAVTASIFSRGEKSSVALSFLKALTYVLGIAVMYSTLGTVAAFTGGFFGGILQSVWVRLGIAAMMFALALSMFGVYRLELPASLLSRLGGRRVGFAGLFVSGLLVGIFAAPCIGPPVVALLAHVAERQDPVYGFWLFFLLSLGLGFPYLLLGTFSHLLRRLPKSGAWLVWVERLFGVVLLGFAVFYLLSAVAPAGLGGKARNAGQGGGAAQKQGGVVWQEYDRPEVLETALQSGRPVVVDFYADWCLPCQEMDATTYRNADVIRELDRFERIKVDLTDADNELSMDLAQSYRVAGIPTLIFFDSQGQELSEARSTGYIDASDFLQILSQIPSE